MYRLFSLAVVLLWLGAMTALFVRDVWPAWSAQDPPQMTPGKLASLDGLQEQSGFFQVDGQRIGTAWHRVNSNDARTAVYSTMLLDGIKMIPQVLIETETYFDAEGNLDAFNMDVHGVPLTRIRIQGERRGIYFPCELRIGPLVRQANLEVSASRMIGESLRPFAFLPDLRVGQSWRMQVLDPISAVMGRQTQFEQIVARVAAKETIDHNDRSVECFVVETSPEKFRAWVDSKGQVLIQEAETPGLGKLVLRNEPYDGLELKEWKKRFLVKSSRSSKQKPGLNR